MGEIQASVGVSRAWDAYEAGRLVAQNTLKDMDGEPSFFLLFPTIHYKRHGGFESFLKGVWDILPEGTPLIGETTTGFITQQGCYTRGAAAIAVKSPEMKVATAEAHNTKLRPRKASKRAAKKIEEELGDSKRGSNYLISLISGPTIPSLPILGRMNIMNSGFLNEIMARVGVRLSSFFGQGLGKEEVIIEQLAELMPEYSMVGNTATDDGKMLSNYQFRNKEVLTNSMVLMGFNINKPVSLDSNTISHRVGKTFDVTGTDFGNRIITSINGRPARKQLMEILDLSDERFKELEPFYYKTSVYFPMTFGKGEKEPIGAGAFLGNSVLMSPGKVRGEKGEVLSVNGEEIIDGIEEELSNYSGEVPFMLMFSSAIFSYILGRRTLTIKEKIDENLGETPYLALLSQVETIKLRDEEPSVRAYSFNTLSVGDK